MYTELIVVVTLYLTLQCCFYTGIFVMQYGWQNRRPYDFNTIRRLLIIKLELKVWQMWETKQYKIQNYTTKNTQN